MFVGGEEGEGEGEGEGRRGGRGHLVSSSASPDMAFSILSTTSMLQLVVRCSRRSVLVLQEGEVCYDELAL
jgi:hypothetical protein